MNIMLTLRYDGTNYCGYQRQINGMTVQEKVEDALCLTFNHPISVIGASRTDAGVHSLGQRVSFCLEALKIPLAKLPYVLNNHLPEDIRVIQAEEVAADFNPRFKAKDKTYQYKIDNSPFPNPLLRNYTCFWPYPLDIRKMQSAAEQFVGRHDFSAFCASGSSVRSMVREIYVCNVKKEDELISVMIRGNGFLYNMVRIIAGTLMYVGQGKIPADAISEIILSKDRTKSGKTAPPQGLYLLEIRY